MRLDKFISNNARISRSMVRRLIRAREIFVNGAPAASPAANVGPADRVQVRQADIEPVGVLYYMLHKPAGYICATTAGDHPTVLDLLHPDEANHRGLQIVGRLDADTTGLVLLTNDGQWNHRVTAPAAGCRKTYEVTLAEPFDPTTAPLIREGIILRGEKRPTKPAELEVLGPRQVQLVLSEGRYHQVKRMFAATGNRVEKLHRTRVGEIQLDASLEPGQYRPLTQREIDSAWHGETP